MAVLPNRSARMVPRQPTLGKIARKHYHSAMRYLLASVICLVAAAPALGQDLTAMSAAKRFTVVLESPEKPSGINVIHSRVLRVRDAQGQAVADATISVAGGMAAHGHGLPTAPRVTRHLGDGRYLIEGLKYNMSGKWQLKFTIDAAGQRDTALFDFAVK